MSDEIIATWGFWLTAAGTIFGLASLLLAFYISVNTKKIRNNFTKKHLQKKYLKSKRSLLLEMQTSYSLLVEYEKLDSVKINESIISLIVYSDILTHATKRRLKILRKKVNNNTINDTIAGKNKISQLLYEIIKGLESELDEHTEFLKETTR